MKVTIDLFMLSLKILYVFKIKIHCRSPVMKYTGCFMSKAEIMGECVFVKLSKSARMNSKCDYVENQIKYLSKVF